MSGEVLSQGEVEALLAALEAPAAGKPAAKPAANASAIAAGADMLPADVTIYDFKRPERVSKEHMRSLTTIHETFARNFGALLSGYMRTIVDVKLVSVDQLTYSEFIFSLENPTCFNVLTCNPLEGFTVLELNPSIVFPMLDRLLGGGKGKPLIPKRALTEIETRLVGGITRRALDALSNAWLNVSPIKFAVDRVESNPQLVFIVPPNEVIVLVSLELTLGEVRGMANLCIPFNVIEPVVSNLSTNTWFSSRKNQQTVGDNLRHAVRNATVELVIHLGETVITAKDLAELQPGDVLPLEKKAGSGLLVTVEGKPKFRGRPFVHKNRKVLLIENGVTPDSRIN